MNTPARLLSLPSAVLAAAMVLAPAAAEAQDQPTPHLPAPHASVPLNPKMVPGSSILRRGALPGGLPRNAQNHPAAAAPPPPPPPAPAPDNGGTGGGGGGGANEGEERFAIDRNEVATQRFKLKFDKVEIEELVKQVADMTGKMFILPENIRGKITIIGPMHGEATVTAEEVYQAFLSALDANHLTVYPTGKFYRIEEKNQAKNSNIPTYVPDGTPYPLNEGMVTKLFRVKYVEADPINGAIADMVSKDGNSKVFQPDLIIINDQALNMHRLEKIIEQLDQPGGTDTLHVVQVQFALATDLADKLNKVFEVKKPPPGARQGSVQLQINKNAPGPTPTGLDAGPSLRLVLADERTNKLVLICNDRTFERAMLVIRDLDVPTAGTGGVHVVYLQNGAAEPLAQTLSNITQGTQNNKGGARPPGGSGRTAAELFQGEVKVTAEKSTNSLVIIASDADFRNLLRVIEKLDIPRREVFVEAVIMEVDLNHNNTFGARLHSGLPPINTNALGASGQAVSVVADKFESGVPPSFSLGSLLNFQGFLAGLQGPAIPELAKFGLNVPSFGVLIHALEADDDVNVLSTPHILTTDNEEAEITVGQNVPFQAGFSPASLSSSLGGLTGTSATTSSALGSGVGAGLGSLVGGLGSFFAPIQRQNVDLKLKIKPQINEGNQIKMLIDEQTEEIASQDPVLGPTTSKRSAKTTIVVSDQQTVVIGGMIQDRTIESVNKVPILGDIPILGHLFREESRQKIRTNLLLFLTPYIIRDQTDFQRIFQRKMKERQDFVEQFYGREAGYEAYIDYAHKAGPIAHMQETLKTEATRVENGGSGQGTGERLISPTSRWTTEPGSQPPGAPGAETGQPAPGQAPPASPPPAPGAQQDESPRSEGHRGLILAIPPPQGQPGEAEPPGETPAIPVGPAPEQHIEVQPQANPPAP